MRHAFTDLKESPEPPGLPCVLQAANISKERLASFDRPIVSEPKFSKEQCEGLKTDLTAYLQTLKVAFALTNLQAALSGRQHAFTCMLPSTTGIVCLR